jgi:NADH dehydrogenase
MMFVMSYVTWDVSADFRVHAGASGSPLPGIAPVAKQQGEYMGRLLKARSLGNDCPPFRYRDFGMMAIGRKSAVAQLCGLHFGGLFAWLLWSAAHVYYLIGFRNRLAVSP